MQQFKQLKNEVADLGKNASPEVSNFVNHYEALSSQGAAMLKEAQRAERLSRSEGANEADVAR